ncbi:Mu transposase C-terminal domain-containing protein [Loktanella sp. TSTF-M6]|uniref:Mu transposase C-terminal domain-containing protein n=1 Tax=Loktanella gaetbuli TaxID=2881335 RepID=A0ABS8BSL7_9RHOB|nr:transposase domain-containing protein [Loktanella gaetbuli]MCB5198569.1 Mu transposase C-terminal domain-containing protein [Loktanella gaetbuli]
MTRAPQQEWWTAAEIAAAGLPDMPGTKRRINAMAQRLGWDRAPQLVRRRAGRGGGREYHWTLFPARAQQKLLTKSSDAAPLPAASDKPSRDEAWAWFEGLPAKAKATAEERLKVIQSVEAMEQGGASRIVAVDDAAALSGKSQRTIFNWFAMIDGVRSDDRLPYLAPRHRAAVKGKRRATIDPTFLDYIKADYLRPEAPSLKSVYDRVVRIAKAEGLDVAPLHTVRRQLDRDLSPTMLTLARKGYEALKRMRPAQTRDKSAMQALEGINGDFHRFDVFVQFPATADGLRAEIARPQLCAFQDIYSGKLLAHRIDRTANSHCVQLTIGDLIERWGIPEHVLLDNGREFASKMITGGVKNRFRFKVKEDDPSGLLTSLGCEIHWALPFSGQSKPIERAFRDLCDRIAKHPAFAGAYTGNTPLAKPENYGERAVPLALFTQIVDEEIAAHNARPDRRSEVAYGRSFDDVFAESYATAPIRKATEAQRRLWLMGAEGIKVNANTGQINFMRNRYWADWMHGIMGQKVVVRFDRQALWDGLHIYSNANEYLGFAPCSEKSGFFDVDDARATARAKREYTKAAKGELDAYRQLTARDVADALPPVEVADEPVAAKVVRPLFDKARAPSPAPISADVQAAQAAMVADLDQARAARAAETAERDGRETFMRARALEEMIAAGDAVTKEQQRWLAGYQGTAEYRTWQGMVADFGLEVLAKE